MQDDRNGRLRDLPGRLRSGKTSTNDMDCLNSSRCHLMIIRRRACKLQWW